MLRVRGVLQGLAVQGMLPVQSMLQPVSRWGCRESHGVWVKTSGLSKSALLVRRTRLIESQKAVTSGRHHPGLKLCRVGKCWGTMLMRREGLTRAARSVVVAELGQVS